MAEEQEEKKSKKYQLTQNVRCAENKWIVCRSKKRPGWYYDFNTSTGEAIWRDPEKVEPNAAMVDQSGKYDCHEPTEPPSHSAYCRHLNVPQSSISPKIYNKQVINNQFPAKPYQIVPYGLLNSSNNVVMSGAPTPVWIYPPPFYGPTLAPNNPVQPIHDSFQNIQIQNTSVPLSSRFQVLNQLNIPRGKPNLEKRNPNTPNDLRNLLSDRRRQDLQHKVSDCPETTGGCSTNSPANVTEDTEWLESHSDHDGKKLNIDMECIWKLADSSANRECWYMVTSSKVLLNNIRFFSTLAVSDDRLRLLAPQDVVPVLRSATFSDNGRSAECAKRLLLTIRQNKLTYTLKDESIFKTCFDLIGQNKHVVLVTDKQDVHDQNTSNMPIFSVNELKQFLSKNFNRNDQTISRTQKIEKIKIVVTNTEAKSENVSRVSSTPSQEVPNIITENKLKANETTKGTDETQIETSASSGKRTANACVQTDFILPVNQFVEITPDQETKISPAVDVSENPNGSTAPKAAPRKIKLKRQFQSPNLTSEYERKTFRWRKRKDACSTPNLTPSVENSHNSCSCASSFLNSTNEFTAQQNDNAVDGELSDEIFNAKLIEETSTSGVVSNSIDSDTMFKVNQRAILNESQANQNEEIIMYEVTSDFMNDRLRTRCDEWAPRFYQIMEEVLSEVLLMEPAFINETLPPPWNIQEATLCIKRKFKARSIIVGAADKLAAFLFKISDNKGNIKQNINSKEFMEMFSYGVNLIKVLQSELPNCEDLEIASNSLFELLSDIREPTLDETIETITDDNLLDNSANVSGTMTSFSSDVPDNTVPDDKGSPINEEKRLSCNNSPARYSLRSRRINNQKTKDEEKSEVPCRSNNDDYSLLSSLGLQKNELKVDKGITRTITNVTRAQQRLTLDPTSECPLADPCNGLVPDITQHEKDTNEVNTRMPKIVRNFTIFPGIEKKLKESANNTHADLVNEGPAQDDQDNVAADVGVEEHLDFTEDENIHNVHFIDENNCTSMQTAINVEQYCESTKSGDVDSNGIFKWVLQRTTYDYNSCIVKLRQFCEKTHEELKAKDFWDPQYKTYVMNKSIEIKERAVNMCTRLERILNRRPSVTKSKFRDVFNVFGVHEDISDSQLSEYRVTIENYYNHTDRLVKFVTHLVNLVKEK